MTRRLGCRGVLPLGLALALPSSVALAQMGQAIASVQAPSLAGSTLQRRLGVNIADALLKSADSEERQRGFERLSSVGTAQALDLLLKVFDPGGAARSARDRLVAVRSLAAHAKVPAVRELLVRIMVGVGSNPERPEAIDGLIEHAAALALAASNDDAALSLLGKALRQPGHVAETASDALLAFPPSSLAPILRGRSAPTKTFSRFLGELGDPRAIPALRDIVRGAPPDVRADAAIALAKLGVGETLELARHWLAHEPSRDLHLAAARILVELRAPDAATAVRDLLSDEQTRSSGLELAGSASLPGLTPTLMELAAKAEGDDRDALLAALGLAGTRDAFSFLGAALGARRTSSAAALALALSPSSDAEATLSLALRAAGTRRVAVRASVARNVALGRAPEGLDEALAALSLSRDPADLATFFQASAVLSARRIPELLRRASPSEIRALARAALVPGAARALAERLASERDVALRPALSACLASIDAAELVPTDVLLALLDTGGLGAPLAARALAARDSPTLRPKILSLLASDDALLRSHVALGLGLSEQSSALGVLEQAYRFEPNESVRLAIVRALASRHEPARKRVLELARSLDAARAVRDAAAVVLHGGEPERRPSGTLAAWLDFTLSPDSSQGRRIDETPAALVITSDGLAVPAFADPDGVLLLPALPTGPLSWRLAAPARTDDAPRSKPPWPIRKPQDPRLIRPLPRPWRASKARSSGCTRSSSGWKAASSI